MLPPVIGVRVDAAPPLLAEVVARALVGAGVELTEAGEPLVSVVTADRADHAVGRIVLVLGDSAAGDVTVSVDGAPVGVLEIDAARLRDLVLDLAAGVSHEATHP